MAYFPRSWFASTDYASEYWGPVLKGHGFKGAGKRVNHFIIAEIVGENYFDNLIQRQAKMELVKRVLLQEHYANQEQIFNKAMEKMNNYTALILAESL